MNSSDEKNNYLLHSNIQDEVEMNEYSNGKVLCQHCGRTAKNGIRCLGICVADNDY